MRKTLIGLVAAASLLAGVGCGGDDDDDTGGGGGASGYSQEVQDNYMNACTAAPGASEDVCQCTLDAVMENVPFDEYQAFETAIREDPSTPLPAGLIDATTACA